MEAGHVFETRRYLHFDAPIGPADARALATDPQRVASWSFLPMLKCVLSVGKVKRGANGVLEKKIKERPICYGAHRDAAIYSYYGHLLSNAYEKILGARGLGAIVTAFRPDCGKCNIDFAKDAFDYIRNQGNCVALAFDIKSFFDNLDHKILKRRWAVVLGSDVLPSDHYAVYKSLTRFSFVLRQDALAALGISKHNPRAGNRKRLCSADDFRTKIRGRGLVTTNANSFGIPQGSPMSAVLSNVYMLDFDAAVNEKVVSVGGCYRRYCDDMLCIVPLEKESEIERFVMEEIAKYRLEIQATKTMRHHFMASQGAVSCDKPLQYLGFIFDGDRVLLRNAGIGKFYSKMRAAVRLAAATKRKADRRRPPIGPAANPIRRKKLNVRYSYLGGRNFISYALRAARNFGQPTIKKQVRRHWKKLNTTVSRA